MIAVVIAASLLIGVSLGILGGGGSILTVPILVYIAGQDAKQAIATSLFVVGVTSAAGMISHARAGRVRWRTGLLFGAAGMTGAYAGGRVAEFIPGNILLIAFGVMMVVTAVAMIRGRKNAPKKVHHELPVGRVLLDGIVVGLVTGLVGAGGGFLVVPALALLGGLPMGVAVGTSLLVISMKSFAGLAGYLSSVQIDWGMAAIVTTAAVVGSLVGGRLAGRIPQDALRKAFGWFVITMGVFVLGQQVSADLRETVLTSPVTWIVVAAGAGLALFQYLRGRARRAKEPTAGQLHPGPGHPTDSPPLGSGRRAA
ncbi:sulfite exporter TauE/SafE family protein [Streptomyces sp. GC420]|uniref:sulfite exporter TauE/SafE family protein n=1 Tax=Streptomyces sp. GC420 TaxID=2697568 RepID=UPI0014150B65|nr:sulfite exporter TauE/SafE family protein [Streptomyces sp. GC420]NBM17784.1 TSUP family transporter [Streptomyces sp. GC420]